MTRRQALPQLGDEVFLTDGGMETDLIFNRGLDLPLFASFVLLDDPDTAAVVRDYFGEYLRIAAETGHGLVLETPTWRASSDWGEQLGYDDARLADVNRRGVQNLLDLREQDGGGRVVISGCVGPRGDAYADLGSMTVDEASQYHSVQIGVLADSGVDLVSALTLHQHRRSRRGRPRRPGLRHTGGDLVHGGDRRRVADRDGGRRRRPGRRCRDRRRARLLHDQLPRIQTTSPANWPTTIPHSSASEGFGPMPRASATPSWTSARSSTTAIPTSSVANSRGCTLSSPT